MPGEPHSSSDGGDHLRAIELQVLGYLLAHREARDTVDGIMQWWLSGATSRWRGAEVAAALEALVARGWLTTSGQGRDETRYGLSPGHVDEIRRFLEQVSESAAGAERRGREGEALFEALRALDALLADVVAAVPASHDAGGPSDLLRGLYITPQEFERLLSHDPHAAAVESQGRLLETALACAPLARLGARFELEPFDLALLLLAVAVDLDLRYERLYAFLQDDVTRRRPSLDLCLNLLCRTPEEKIARRTRVSAGAPLVFHGLVQLVADPNQLQPPLLATYLRPDEQIIRLLLGQREMDVELARFCRVSTADEPWADLTLDHVLSDGIRRFLSHPDGDAHPLRLHLQGATAAARTRAARALARRAGRGLLEVNLERLLSGRDDAERQMARVLREATIQDAVPFFEGLAEASLPSAALERVARARQPMITGSASQGVPNSLATLGLVSVPLRVPGHRERRSVWERTVGDQGARLDADTAEVLSERFRLLPDQIADAVSSAFEQARVRGSPDGDAPVPAPEELFAAARAQSGQELAALARRVQPAATWKSIVVPASTEIQLREMCAWVASRSRVLADWGFDRRLALGKGLTALFVGPTGVGKTLAAEVMARELQLELFKIDLSTVVSKYVGDTEKTLEKIFAAAECTDAVLFFDEADALFGKRSEVRDSHDRYANIEVAFLLQKMEQYEGIAILATNLRANMDEAFTRRLQFVVEFPFPDERLRRDLWRVLFPPETPRDEAIDFGALARLRLAGGNVKNVVLSAAFLAAAEGKPVGMAHLVHAAHREFEKLGLPWSGELGEFETRAPVRTQVSA